MSAVLHGLPWLVRDLAALPVFALLAPLAPPLDALFGALLAAPLDALFAAVFAPPLLLPLLREPVFAAFDAAIHAL